MSELARTHEISRSAEVIAGGIEDWVRKINVPATDPTRAADDYSTFVEGLKLAYDDPANGNGQGNSARHARLVSWSIDFLRHYAASQGERRDVLLARQIFCAQTYIARLIRMRKMLQASDADDYRLRLSADPAADEDLDSAVQDRLGRLFRDVPAPNGFLEVTGVDTESLAHGTTTLNERHRVHVAALYQSGHLDVGEENSPTVRDNLDIQKWWTGLIVEYVAFGAQERGGHLSSVPSLRPLSAEEAPLVYYPFDGGNPSAKISG